MGGPFIVAMPIGGVLDFGVGVGVRETPNFEIITVRRKFNANVAVNS